jgi:anthranilate phosphoribosyltransferase
MTTFADALGKLAAGASLSAEETASVVDLMMQGKASEDEISRFLLGLREMGETVDEVVGAARAMRLHMATIHSRRMNLIDTCGTGGDPSGTFNISTAAAIVTAAAGAPVAKHGNRGLTSKSGSADVLAELGVNLDAPLAVVEGCLDELGICFCFAPLCHQSMKHVGPVRRKLGVPTVFNLLGPLANPAGAAFQVIGVARPERRGLLANALLRLGVRRAIVVHGEDRLDEVTLAGRTFVTEVSATGLRELEWTPEDFGLPRAGREAMQVSGPADSAAVIRQVFAGRAGPPRDIVIANAAAALWTASVFDDLRLGAQRAAAAIDSGAAARLLDQLAARSHA